MADPESLNSTHGIVGAIGMGLGSVLAVFGRAMLRAIGFGRGTEVRISEVDPEKEELRRQLTEQRNETILARVEAMISESASKTEKEIRDGFALLHDDLTKISADMIRLATRAESAAK